MCSREMGRTQLKKRALRASILKNTTQLHAMASYDQLAGQRRPEASKGHRERANAAKRYLLEHAASLAVATQTSTTFRVRELACGQGGDLSKWSVLFTHPDSSARLHPSDPALFVEWHGNDVSSASVEEAKRRLDSYRRQSGSRLLESSHAEVGDMNEALVAQDSAYDALSCQFAFHYAVPHMALWWRNARQLVRVGGVVAVTFMDGATAKTTGMTRWEREGASLEWRDEARTKYVFRMEGSVRDEEEWVVSVREVAREALANGFDVVASHSLPEWIALHESLFGRDALAEEDGFAEETETLLAHCRGMVFVRQM